MESVDLYMAFGWVCLKCQSQNYCDGPAVEMTDDDLIGAGEVLGEDFEDHEWIYVPRAVKCKECKTKFKVNQVYIK